MSEPDSKLNEAIWWGAVLNAIATAIIGAAFFGMGVGVDKDRILVAIFGVIPALIYFTFWVYLLQDLPRTSRIMIGIFSFLVSAWLAYYMYEVRISFWYILVPVFIYFSTIAVVAFKQLHAVQKDSSNVSPPYGGNAA
jgi:hypothetical protein